MSRKRTTHALAQVSIPHLNVGLSCWMRWSLLCWYRGDES
ncbi:Uncharacterised protein [Vibrio cholerae]|nr:Uncharacterised protein [Vibrio cholerae]